MTTVPAPAKHIVLTTRCYGKGCVGLVMQGHVMRCTRCGSTLVVYDRHEA